eukprot:11187925-Lingulodinium_polyedra.AAC.1
MVRFFAVFAARTTGWVRRVCLSRVADLGCLRFAFRLAEHGPPRCVKDSRVSYADTSCAR